MAFLYANFLVYNTNLKISWSYKKHRKRRHVISQLMASTVYSVDRKLMLLISLDISCWHTVHTLDHAS